MAVKHFGIYVSVISW